MQKAKKRIKKPVQQPIELLEYLLRMMDGHQFEHCAVDLSAKESIGKYVRRCLKSYKPKR